MGEKKNSRVLIRKPEGTRPSGGPGSRQEDGIKFGLEGIGLYLVDFGVIGSGGDHRWVV
jgi:hypothetical protein